MRPWENETEIRQSFRELRELYGSRDMTAAMDAAATKDRGMSDDLIGLLLSLGLLWLAVQWGRKG
jgi:hypothetical protein